MLNRPASIVVLECSRGREVRIMVGSSELTNETIPAEIHFIPDTSLPERHGQIGMGLDRKKNAKIKNSNTLSKVLKRLIYGERLKELNMDPLAKW